MCKHTNVLILSFAKYTCVLSGFVNIFLLLLRVQVITVSKLLPPWPTMFTSNIQGISVNKLFILSDLMVLSIY